MVKEPLLAGHVKPPSLLTVTEGLLLTYWMVSPAVLLGKQSWILADLASPLLAQLITLLAVGQFTGSEGQVVPEGPAPDSSEHSMQAIVNIGTILIGTMLLHAVLLHIVLAASEDDGEETSHA